MIMTERARNSMELYRGGNPSTIEQLLRMQNVSVVNELKEHFRVNNLSDLAVRLSLG